MKLLHIYSVGKNISNIIAYLVVRGTTWETTWKECG